MSPDEREVGDLSVSMTPRLGAPRKERLNELLALAQAYRGWSMKDLARFVGRDPHNIVPDSGVPKLDLVVRLAEALDWPVASVVEDLCSTGVRVPEGDEPPARFRDLNRAAYDAHVNGRYWDEIQLATQALHVAASPDERAEAALREHLGWGGLGRYQLAIEAANRGLLEVDAPVQLRMRLRANLANGYFCLGRGAEADGIATSVLAWFDRHPTDDLTWISMRAFSHYVRGQARRAQALVERSQQEEWAQLAIADFDEAEQQWNDFARRVGIDGFRGIAHTCRGARLSLRVLLGQTSAHDALKIVDETLEKIVDVSAVPAGDWLESYGWWCLFGCHIALQKLEAERQLDRRLAVYTNKAYEVADRLGHWALRQRVLALDYLVQSHESGAHVASTSPTFDDEDLRALAGTMGRFPSFRGVGWEMLRRARVV